MPEGRARRRLDFTYVLPLASASPVDVDETTRYLEALAARCELIVVDGSPPVVFGAHHRSWGGFAIHVAPEEETLCGKVGGVMTGVRRAAHELVVIADDDVRYGDELEQLVDRLLQADVVLPQNYFDPLPWHALWDSSRSLLNRVSGGDWPGTVALRRSALLGAGGYSGNVLFENFELCAVVAEAGGRVSRADDLFVRRLPPTAAHFRGQRVRQAYDEWARTARLGLFAAILPAWSALSVVAAPGCRLRRAVLVALGVGATVCALAEAGRRKEGASRYFPLRCSLVAPAWVVERAVCVWVAIGARLRGGVRYRDRRIPRAALSRQERLLWVQAAAAAPEAAVCPARAPDETRPVCLPAPVPVLQSSPEPARR